VHAARPRVESASSLFTSPSPVSSTLNSLSPTACFIYILSFSLSLSPSVVLSSSSTTRDRKIHPHRTSASFSPPLNRASIVHFNDLVLVSHLLTRLCLLRPGASRGSRIPVYFPYFFILLDSDTQAPPFHADECAPSLSLSPSVTFLCILICVLARLICVGSPRSVIAPCSSLSSDNSTRR